MYNTLVKVGWFLNWDENPRSQSSKVWSFTNPSVLLHAERGDANSVALDGNKKNIYINIYRDSNKNF